MTTAQKGGSRRKAVEAIKKTEVIASVGELSLGGVADHIAKTQVAVQKQLGEVSNQLTSNLVILQNVQEAIAIKKQELQGLHGIEAAAIALDDLKGEIETTRAAWEAEQAEREKAVADADAELEKVRARDEEEYQYRTDQDHRHQQSEFAERLAALRKAEEERASLLERQFAAREAELAARERELKDLREAVQRHPLEVKKEVDAAVAVATNSLKRNLELDHKLQAKDAEVKLQLSQQETLSARQEVGRLTQTIGDLRVQLDSAYKSAQAVAEKALDSASGRSALDTLQQSLSRDTAAPSGPRAGR